MLSLSRSLQPLLRLLLRQLSAFKWPLIRLSQLADAVLTHAKGWQVAIILAGVVIFSLPLIMTALTPNQQFLLAVMTLVLSISLLRFEEKLNNPVVSEQIHLFLIWLSIITTCRYLVYRVSGTLNFSGVLNSIASLLLFAAELYAILTLLLSYFQTVKLRERISVDIRTIPHEDLFTVDIYIPTYNEDVEIVRKTALAAKAIDYPADKFNVYVLDDGRAEKYRERRQKLREMCAEVGVTMLVRDNNEHAKAGNINTALKNTPGQLVLILDCDHMPTRKILREMVGYFVNPKVALVQSPHWFYNPDPYERNLLTRGRIPVGNELFYKTIQKGNDYWNAAFFCGSAAVVRKEYVLQVGGIAVETVTEDCHTAFRLHSLGYESVYHDKIMVAGLAPEKFSAYVGQQVRWARGMAQILRIENPLTNRKLNLTIPQRLCYFSATSHFFYGIPRLIYAFAPPLYLLFGINPVRGLGFVTLAYAIPHIILSLHTNYIPQKHVRFTFWNELFEYSLAFQTAYVTVMAMINPKLGSFNVTDKGLVVTKRDFDWESSRLLVITVSFILFALATVPFWLLLRPEEYQAIMVNAGWGMFNMLLLLPSVLVSLEQPQLRRTHRLERTMLTILTTRGRTYVGYTDNVSETGARVVFDVPPALLDVVEVELVGDFGARVVIPKAQVVTKFPPKRDGKTAIAVDFGEMSQSEMDALAIVLYSDVDEWYSQDRAEKDNAFASIWFLITAFARVLQDFKPAARRPVRKQTSMVSKIFWEGRYYPGIITEIGVKSMMIDIYDAEILAKQAHLVNSKPLVGVSLTGNLPKDVSRNFLAEVSDAQLSQDTQGQLLRIELQFPEQIQERQQDKLERILQIA